MDQQSCDGAQQLHDQQHSLGSTHDLWVDRQRSDELLELHLPSDRAKQDGWVPSSHAPSMAQHPESMVEIHPRPTTPASTGSKDIEHLRGSLAIRPLRNITGPTRKGASSSGNLSEKVSHRRDNRGFDSRDPFAAQAHPNSIIHGELHLGVSHEADASAIAGTCHHPSTESSDAQRGIEAGGMEMDDIQEGLCPGMDILQAFHQVQLSHYFREASQVADLLAKMGSSQREDFVYYVSPPLTLLDGLAFDCASSSAPNVIRNFETIVSFDTRYLAG
ncbi:hypothetical protein CMV_024810 [Castanea mollissima]|uniref:Uncharacterized protein n=1 Tax=Castanea mollissima TaxID=60419 RepID=A0A8J4QA58_9ROSI|nr:hypothetical protein CMV_024810 [Castanea mollissima]